MVVQTQKLEEGWQLSEEIMCGCGDHRSLGGERLPGQAGLAQGGFRQQQGQVGEQQHEAAG